MLAFPSSDPSILACVQPRYTSESLTCNGQRIATNNMNHQDAGVGMLKKTNTFLNIYWSSNMIFFTKNDLPTKTSNNWNYHETPRKKLTMIGSLKDLPHLRTNKSIRAILPGADSGCLNKICINPAAIDFLSMECIQDVSMESMECRFVVFFGCTNMMTIHNHIGKKKNIYIYIYSIYILYI